MKKKIDPTAITNDLKNASLHFFHQNDEAQETNSPPASIAPQKPIASKSTAPPTPSGTVQPRYRDTTADTTIPRNHDTILETTRRAVKQFGKEAATHRFTPEEKRALKSIEHLYSEQNIRTSENEITRIAINYILEDYKIKGKDSILSQVIALLNA